MDKKEFVLLEKEYDSESLVDKDRDVNEMFQFPEDKDLLKVPVDEYGFHRGSFKVKIVYMDVVSSNYG